MDVTEAAALLGVSPWLVLQQIAKGNLPHKRFGRRIIIPGAAFLTWLEDVDEPAQFNYRSAVKPTFSAAPGRAPLKRREVARPWEPGHAAAMRERGLAVYEEQVVQALLAVWPDGSSASDGSPTETRAERLDQL